MASIEIRPFTHAHIEASAEVPKNGDPAKVLAQLKAFVRAELAKAKAEDVRRLGEDDEPVIQVRGRNW